MYLTGSSLKESRAFSLHQRIILVYARIRDTYHVFRVTTKFPPPPLPPYYYIKVHGQISWREMQEPHLQSPRPWMDGDARRSRAPHLKISPQGLARGHPALSEEMIPKWNSYETTTCLHESTGCHVGEASWRPRCGCQLPHSSCPTVYALSCLPYLASSHIPFPAFHAVPRTIRIRQDTVHRS